MTNERLDILLYNAISMLEEEGLEKDTILEELGMTADEYEEIMFD